MISEQTKLFVLSDPPIATVFSDEKPRSSGEITAHQRSVMDDLGLSFDVVGASSIFTGDEEVFAFARALVSLRLRLAELSNGSDEPNPSLISALFFESQSRLNEMSGVQWSQSSKMKEVVN